MSDDGLYDTGLPDSGLLTIDQIADVILGLVSLTCGLLLWRRRSWR